MKKIYVLALCSALAINISCKKDDDGANDQNNPLSVEEGKAQLEDNTVELLNKIESFKNDDALTQIVDLAECIQPASSSKISPFKKTFFTTVTNISTIQNTQGGLTTFNAKQATTILTDTPLADDFNEEKGIYQWNSTTEDFDKTGDSDDIIYNITCNGKVTVFSFTDFNTKLAGSDSDEEVPTLIKANLKINNTVVFSQDYSASFQDGQLIPASIENTTNIGGFTFLTSYSNSNNTSITQSFEFKINDEVITGFNYAANGNFNNEDDDIEDIVNNANISFQFLKATLAITAVDTDFDSNADLSIDEQIAILNSNVNAELSIDNRSIAKSEFYKDELDGDEIANLRFLFEDGTSNDFDTYIEGSFTEVEDKFEAVFDAYEDLFGDIDLD